MLKKIIKTIGIYIYLTPTGDKPIDASVEESKYWCLLSYQAISDILEDLLNEETIDSKVSYIIREYHDNIRKNILNDTELKELSAEIYFKYKEVLDLIIENRPNTLDFREKLVEILKYFSDESKIIFDEKYCSKSILRFRTNQLDEFLENNVDDSKKEWSTGSAYFYEITFTNFQADIYISIYSKQQTVVQSQKLKIVTDERYSKWGFNTSKKFLSFDASYENLFISESEEKLINFISETLEQIDDFEQELISRWNEQQGER